MLVTLDGLREVIASVKGAKFATIVTKTDVKMTGGKSNPYYGRVTKVARVHGMINWLYENAVNNKREKEGQPLTNDGEIEKFISQPRAWGKRLHLEVGNKQLLLPFVHHIKGIKSDGSSHRVLNEIEFESLPSEELYLEFRPQSSIEYQYFVDGEPISNEVIEAYLPNRSSEGKTQLTDDIVRVRDYSLQSIVELYLNDEVYTVDRVQV